LRELTNDETILVGGGMLPFPIPQNLPHPTQEPYWV